MLFSEVAEVHPQDTKVAAASKQLAAALLVYPGAQTARPHVHCIFHGVQESQFPRGQHVLHLVVETAAAAVFLQLRQLICYGYLPHLLHGPKNFMNCFLSPVGFFVIGSVGVDYFLQA